MTNNIVVRFPVLLICALALTLGACTSSRVQKESTLFPLTEDDSFSTVYIFREADKTRMAVAEDAIKIEINGEALLKMSMGEYFMVRIIPMEGTVTVKNLSYVTDKPDPVVMEESRTFNFAADQTNFIRLKAINEEFRGVYFIPERIEFDEAREISKRLRPSGLARKHPIRKL